MATKTMRQIEDTALHSVAYEQALAAIARQRADLLASQASAKQTHDVEYGDTLSKLGWNPGQKSWDYGSLATDYGLPTTSGRAYQSLMNDFAARGMLHSGAFTVANNTLGNTLADQLRTQQAANTAFGVKQTQDVNAFEQQAEQQRLAALQSARNAEMSRILGGN